MAVARTFELAFFLSDIRSCDDASHSPLIFQCQFSSFERNRNIERTRSGLAAARARGRVGGRKPSLSEEDVKQIRILLADPEMTVGAVAKRFNVSRMTIYRYTTKS